ncbi:MAG: hypothetical protein AAF726_09030 [Planctomycetota bacterium]
MPHTLTVYDETTGGARDEALALTFPTDEITVRALIRERVYQEVKDHNAREASATVFRGLVQPSDAEATLEGYRLRNPRMIDWEPQFELAVAAFEQNQILVLVDDRQAETLDQTLHVRTGTEVTFLKLTPLVGG